MHPASSIVIIFNIMCVCVCGAHFIFTRRWFIFASFAWKHLGRDLFMASIFDEPS